MCGRTWRWRAGRCPMRRCGGAWLRTSPAYDGVVDLRAVGLPDVLAAGVLAARRALQRGVVAGTADRPDRRHCAAGARDPRRAPSGLRLARAGLGLGGLGFSLAALCRDLP